MIFLRNLLLVMVLAAAALVAAIYILQDSILFSTQSITAERLNFLTENYPHAEDVKIMTADGVELHGWFVKNTHQRKAPLVIYFGGNAEEVSGQVESAHLLAGWNLLAVNYRGYGLSEGSPAEDALFSDALSIYDQAVERDDVDTDRIVVMGRSIGSGVAVHLAASREVSGVILISPYDSIAAVARDQLRFLFFSSLLKHPFDVRSKAGHIQAPLLAIIGSEDRVIRPHRSEKLVSTWGGSREIRILEREGHNTLQMNPIFWESIRDFLVDI